MKTEPAEVPTDHDDAALARLVGRRDGPAAAQTAATAFNDLYRRYAPRLLAFLAARLGPTEADDALQDLWVRVWRALGEPGRFDGRNFLAWSFTIARHLVTDHNRRRPARGLGPDVPEPVDHRGAVGDAALLESERRAALARCLGTLSAEERAVFQARLGGEDPAQIAGRLALKADRVYKTFFQAKAKLKACVERLIP
jgi:RNA polymerase sigma-70 factor (ECF subfamily)